MNNNATRQRDVASLARTCLLNVAQYRDTSIKRKNRENCRDVTGGESERENLDAGVSEKPHQGLWAIFANAWRILERVRKTQIDDPVARFKKRGVSGEGRGELSVQVEKKTSRLNLSLSSFRAYEYVSVRGFLWALRYVGGPVLVGECPPKTRRDAFIPGWRITRLGIARNNYKHRGVTINLPIRLDNNKRITEMWGPVGREGEGQEVGAAKARGGKHPRSAWFKMLILFVSWRQPRWLRRSYETRRAKRISLPFVTYDLEI